MADHRTIEVRPLTPHVGAEVWRTDPDGGYPRSEHPVIATHPETGRRILYVRPPAAGGR